MILNNISMDIIYGQDAANEHHTSFSEMNLIWNIQHNFNIRHGIIVKCTDIRHKILREDIDYVVNFLDMNTLVINFNTPMSGFCICKHFEGHQSIESIKASNINEAINQLIESLEIDDLKSLYPEMNNLKLKIEEKILLES